MSAAPTPSQTYLLPPPVPIMNARAGPNRPAARRVRSQSVSDSITPPLLRPPLFHAKQSTPPFPHRFRGSTGAALNTLPSRSRRNSQPIASIRTQSQDESLKWDVEAWGEHVAQHRPKRARLDRAHDTDSDNNATEHAPHVDPRLSLAIQDLSKIELMAIHYPHSVANLQVVPSSPFPHLAFDSPVSPCRNQAAPVGRKALGASGTVPFHTQPSPLSPAQSHPQFPPMNLNQSATFLDSRFVQRPSTLTTGPRAPPPSEDSSSCGDIDAIRDVAMDEEEQEICSNPEYPGPDPANASASLSNRDNDSVMPQPPGIARKHRARSMNAVLDLGGFDMTEAFARLAFLDSSSRSSPTGSPRRYNVDGRDVERGRPLTRKRPLEQDGDEHAWRDGLQRPTKLDGDRFENSTPASPVIITPNVSSRPMIPLRVRSMSRASHSVSSCSRASAIYPLTPTSLSPSSIFRIAHASHYGYRPDRAFAVSPSIVEGGEHSLISGGCRTSDSAMHHSLTSLIGSESPVTRFNVPKLRGDNEMDVSETDDIILSPVSSPAHTASTIEHDLAEQHEHSALLSCEYITLQCDR